MTYAQRLRKLANSTGLDAFGDEIRAIADEMDEQPAEVTLDEVMQAAKEATAPEWQDVVDGWHMGLDLMAFARAIIALRARLAQPEQEPVNFKCTVIDDANPNGVPLSQWGKQQKQKPFCYHDGRNIVGKEYADHSDVFPLYTAPPAPAKPMTDDTTLLDFMAERRVSVTPEYEGQWCARQYDDEAEAVAQADGATPRDVLRELHNAHNAHHGITAVPVTALWCIHIPGPDELHAAPSKADAEHMAALHNAAMAEFFEKQCPQIHTPIESVQAVAIPWPHDTQSHADQMREFDWSGWGITDKGGA